MTCRNYYRLTKILVHCSVNFLLKLKKKLLSHSLKSNHPINDVRLSKIHCFSRKYAFFLMITRLDTLFSFNFFFKIHKPCVQAEKISILQKTFYVLQVVSLIYMNIFHLTFLCLNLSIKCTKYD